MDYLISVLLVLVSSLLIQTAICTDPLYTLCPENQTINATTYASNLDNIFLNLQNEASKTGFGNSSSNNEAFGLYLCRGDVLEKKCAACVKEAENQLKQNCKRSPEAIIWYDNCYLKYSNEGFFGKIDSHNTVMMWNLNNASDPQGFYNTTMGLFNDISQNASDETNKDMFASGCKEGPKNETIYGMAQCSRDLFPNDCKQCLQVAVKTLPGISFNIDGTVHTIPVGGRTLKGSCIVRYETYKFIHDR